MTDEELAAVRARHQRLTDENCGLGDDHPHRAMRAGGRGTLDWCYCCMETWPCDDVRHEIAHTDAAALLAEVDRLRGALRAMVDDCPEDDCNGYRVCAYCQAMGDVLAEAPQHRDHCPVASAEAVLLGKSGGA